MAAKLQNRAIEYYYRGGINSLFGAMLGGSQSVDQLALRPLHLGKLPLSVHQLAHGIAEGQLDPATKPSHSSGGGQKATAPEQRLHRSRFLKIESPNQ